jgi:2-methylcitrate dehydratase PrpD
LLARAIAGEIYGLHDRGVDEEVCQAAVACVVDFFAVVLAGLQEPIAKKVRKAVGGLGGAPEATLLCDGSRTSSPLAALVNGTIAHTLDYDDTLWTYIGHATSTIFPAALAAAETVDCSGRDLLGSFAFGVETAHCIGSVVTPELTRRGWHPSPVVGLYGAAATSTLVKGRGVDELAAALTLATNMASGLRQNFGSPAKPLGIGWASHAGVMASLLAEQGVSGSDDAFEGDQGYYKVFAGKKPDPRGDSKDKKMVLVSPGVGFKLYPSCSGTHPTIEAILMIQEKHQPLPEEIEAIHIEVTPEVLGELIYPVPQDASQARFSLPYCAAVALAAGGVRLEHFGDDWLRAPTVRALMERIDVQPREDLFRLGGENCPAARVTIKTRDGREIQESVDAARGNPGNPVRLDDLESKFRQCAAIASLPTEKAEELLSRILGISEVASVAPWMQTDVAPLFRHLGRI